ncbi:MAG: hypothetical protein EOO09_15290 [Chitinophagaceae bacterium]|nr:MAG: hypothetical protein EOO09_15290 [Chitinophagaceae bacterium]
MKNKEQKHAGLWIDGKQGVIISNEDGEDYSVTARVDLSESQSGGSEHAMNNGKKTEMAKYFRELSHHLVTYDEILIFGPGQSQEQLQHFLNEDAQFKHKKLTLDSSERLTDPQMLAKVREFYKGK